MPNMIQQGSYNSAKGMDSYIPFKYAVSNLRTDTIDAYGMRTHLRYEKAVILANPEKIYSIYEQMISNSGKGLTNEDIQRAASNGLINRLLKEMPGSSLINNELCPMDRTATTRYDFESVFYFLDNIKKALSSRGANLSDVVIIIEEPFFGVDLRLTEHGKTNPGFLRENYPNHHFINKATVAPKSGKGTSIYFGNIIDPANVKAGQGTSGVLHNTHLDLYDANVKKKKTVKNVALEYQTLEEIRKLGGADSIHEGNFSGKKAELKKLVDRLEIKDLANNDTVAGMKGLDDGLIHDLSLVHQILQYAIKNNLQNKVHVDFYEEIQGTNGRHFISSAFIYDKNGYKGVTGDYIKELTPR